jgi:hypothetical protein
MTARTFFSAAARTLFAVTVPPGSLAKGEILVRTGNGKVAPGTACHSADLRGLGPIAPASGQR